eukprot:1046807-Prymnesium_polylepis.1
MNRLTMSESSCARCVRWFSKSVSACATMRKALLSRAMTTACSTTGRSESCDAGSKIAPGRAKAASDSEKTGTPSTRRASGWM